MKNLLKNEDREALIARLQNLRPDNHRRWGKMTVNQILPHLADPFRATLGEKNATNISNLVMRGFIGKMLVRYVPWPKGSITSPSFLPGTGLSSYKDFEADKQALILLIDRFANSPENIAFTPHPVFGTLNRQDYGRLHWRHLDHHLRQFSA